MHWSGCVVNIQLCQLIRLSQKTTNVWMLMSLPYSQYAIYGHIYSKQYIDAPVYWNPFFIWYVLLTDLMQCTGMLAASSQSGTINLTGTWAWLKMERFPGWVIFLIPSPTFTFFHVASGYVTVPFELIFNNTNLMS